MSLNYEPSSEPIHISGSATGHLEHRLRHRAQERAQADTLPAPRRFSTLGPLKYWLPQTLRLPALGGAIWIPEQVADAAVRVELSAQRVLPLVYGKNWLVWASRNGIDPIV